MPGIAETTLFVQHVVMLSPQERHLLIGILLVLMIGGVVKACRSRVTVEQGPKEALPTLDAPPPKPGTVD